MPAIIYCKIILLLHCRSWVDAGFTKSQLGWAFSAFSIAYGFSKFIMGTVSDRSNAQIFLPLGLILTALVNLCLGLIPVLTQSLNIMAVLLFLIGWFEGMGLPPIEVYHNDFPNQGHKLYEKEMTNKEILFQYVLNNKWVWLIAFANIFVYFVRYGVEN